MQHALRINAFLFVLAGALFFINPFASIAAKYNTETLVSATSIYTSYRVINRVMSVAADTSIQVGIVGTSAGFKPGQILRSLLDTLDRFADLLFPLMVLAGVMSLAVVPIATLGAALAALGMALRILSDLITSTSYSFRSSLTRLGNACAGVGFLVALIIPATYTIGYFVGDRITSSSWQEAVATFEAFATEVEGVDEALRDVTTESLPTSDGSFEHSRDDEAQSVSPEGSEAEAEEVDQTGRWRIFDWAGQTSTVIGDAWGSVSDGVTGFAGGALNVGNNSVQAFSSVPEYLGKSSDLVAAAFNYLAALIVKTLIIPILVVGVGIWLWRIMLAPAINSVRAVPDIKDQSSIARK